VSNNYVLPWQAFVGITMILVGFLGMNVSEEVLYFKTTRYQFAWEGKKFVWGSILTDITAEGPVDSERCNKGEKVMVNTNLL